MDEMDMSYMRFRWAFGVKKQIYNSTVLPKHISTLTPRLKIATVKGVKAEA